MHSNFMQRTKNNHGTILFFMIINIIFLFLFFSTPLYHHYIYLSDSGIYANIAKEMLNGKILYKEIFDHKGPFIFFIYLFAQLFSDINWGVYLIDILFFNIAFYFQYKTIKLFSNNKTATLLLLIEFILLFKTYGIVIPETIAFMTISYISYWFLSKQYQNPTLIQLIICGILTGILFWIKFSLCVFILVVYLYFIIKNYNPKHIVYPLIGFIIPTIIVLIYFFYNQAFSDLIHSYFIINSGYKNSVFIPSLNFWFLSCYLVGLCVCSVVNKQPEITVITIGYGTLVVLSFLMTGKNFPNYYLPFMGVISLFSFIKIDSKYFNKLKAICIILLIVIFLFLLFNHTTQLEQSSHGFQDPIKLSEDISEIESIALLYQSETAILGQLKDLNYKYFFTPSLLYEQCPEMWETLYQDISASNIEYLLTVYNGEIQHYDFYNGSEKTLEYIQKINQQIQKNYCQYKTYHNYVLWKKNT